MTDPTQALEALLSELTRRGSLLANFLEPGLPAEQVKARLAELGADPHPDVIKLYTWHNGFNRFRVPVSDNGLVSLVPSHQEFNPFEEAAELYASWRQRAESDAATPVRHLNRGWITIDPEDVWSRSWFPIFEGRGSEVIFIDNHADDAGSVWLHPIQDAPRRLYDSLGAAMDSVRQALVDGRLELDSQGVFTFESYIGGQVPTEIDVQKLAILVRAKRGRLGLRAAADQIGDVSASTLSRIEQGKAPDLDTFLRICEWLGANPDELLHGHGERPRSNALPDTEDIIAAHLRADRTLDPNTAQALETMVRLAYKAAREGKLQRRRSG